MNQIQRVSARQLRRENDQRRSGRIRLRYVQGRTEPGFGQRANQAQIATIGQCDQPKRARSNAAPLIHVAQRIRSGRAQYKIVNG